MLSAQQINSYKRDGFLVIPAFVPENKCDSVRKRAQQMVHDFDPAGIKSIFSTHEQNRVADDYFLGSSDKIRFFFEEDAFDDVGELLHDKLHSINKIGHALHELDEVFSEFSRTTEIQRLVADIGITNPLLLQSMYIFKQPRIGSEVSCHQDSTFLYTEPAEIIGLWFALEDATVANGCLWAIPGGHKLGLKSRWIKTPEGMQFETYDSTPWPEERLVPLEVKMGAVILLHGMLPHKSFANRSARSRQAYTLHVISAKVDYPDSNWLQRPDSMPLRGF
jgi:phytanoyl-CoA hydroxylase